MFFVLFFAIRKNWIMFHADGWELGKLDGQGVQVTWGLTEVQRLRRRLGAGRGACSGEQGPLGARPAPRGGAEQTGAWRAEGLHESSAASQVGVGQVEVYLWERPLQRWGQECLRRQNRLPRSRQDQPRILVSFRISICSK